MTSLSRTKSLTLFLVVCYALAVTASGLFHNHGSCDRCCPPIYSEGFSEADSGETQPPCGCGEHHSSSPQEPAGHGAGEEPSGEPRFSGHSHSDPGLCPICSFLAQKTVASVGPPEVVCTALEKAFAPQLPPAPALLSLYSWHGRAPPVTF